jgi:hypothetical protein
MPMKSGLPSLQGWVAWCFAWGEEARRSTQQVDNGMEERFPLRIGLLHSDIQPINWISSNGKLLRAKTACFDHMATVVMLRDWTKEGVD